LVVAALSWKRQRRRVALTSAEGERARLARDLHDGLGSGVHRVQRLTELLDALDPASPEAQKYREDLRRTSVELSGALGETIWSVKPENDTLEHLLSFLANQGPKLLEPHGIACRLELPDQLPNVTLPGNARPQILYAAKEALNNVVKHSKAQRAWLRVTWAEPWLTIAIEDDGCGIKSTTCAPKNASTGGNGLRNLQTRMESLGGTSSIQPRESGGTRLILRVPFPRAG
jgi:signal transduction histidine kinase